MIAFGIAGFIVVCVVAFSLMKAASDADDQMEEWLHEREGHK